MRRRQPRHIDFRHFDIELIISSFHFAADDAIIDSLRVFLMPAAATLSPFQRFR
jgi:hypothetical protein